MYPHLIIPKLSSDALRELVLARMACQVMFSDEVDPKSWGMVFMPVMFGALNPPKEVLEQVLGSSEPPEALPGEPPKPQHPGYNDKAGDPPQKPVLGKLPQKVQSDHDWGYLPDEDWEKLRVKLEARNQEMIRDWEQASMAWMCALDEDTLARKAVDEAHEEALREWGKSLSQHAEAVAERERLREDWHARSSLLFKEWVQDLGAIVGDMRHAFPRSINGFPIFSQVQFLHKDDWTRIREALIREQKRATDFEV